MPATLLILLLLTAPAVAATATLAVGSRHLEPCTTGPGWCGELSRALDPAGRIPGSIPVYFEFYPHTDPGPRTGTIVATEGGPGYPATESRDAYLALAGPLRANRDLLLMDNRGTGRSGAIDCRPLQRAPVQRIADISACGRSLGARAPLYSTALATDDLAALLDALAIQAIDLYGDSYGTFFAQTFAVRHPGRLRSLVLDGTYPIVGTDIAWYAGYAPAMRAKFNLACERAPACRAVPGSSIDHIVPALARLRARPYEATAVDADGQRQRFRADATRLAITMFGSAPAFATLREVDAAARAFTAGDALPLLRLMAEATASVDSRDPTRNPKLFSEGLAAAVMCQDAPQIFDMRLPPAARARDYARVLARRRAEHPDTYAPFTIDEYRAMRPDYAFIDECVGWPAPDADHPPSVVVPPDARFPAVPVLVLVGELDNMTTLADSAASAAQFPQARQVVFASSPHVNALPQARTACGAQLAQRFIAELDPGDTACAAAVPPPRLAAPFATTYREVEPAVPRAGNAAGEAALRAARAALLTAGDLLGRIEANSSGHGVGLRGGRFTVESRGDTRHATLTNVRWTQDLAVSGTLDWPLRGGEARLALEFHTAGGPGGHVAAHWPEVGAEAVAELDGEVGGLALAARASAP